MLELAWGEEGFINEWMLREFVWGKKNKTRTTEPHIKQQKLVFYYHYYYYHSHNHFSQWTLASIVCLERQAPEWNCKRKKNNIEATVYKNTTHCRKKNSLQYAEMKTHQVTSEVWHFQTTETVGKMSVGSGREWILKSKTTQWSHTLSDFHSCACLSFGRGRPDKGGLAAEKWSFTHHAEWCVGENERCSGTRWARNVLFFFCCRCTLNDGGQLLSRAALETHPKRAWTKGLALAPALIFEIKPTVAL